MKLKHKILAISLISLLVLGGLVSTGATWVRSVGLLPSTAVVFSVNASATDKAMAAVFHTVYGARCDTCSGASDDVEIQAAITAVATTGGRVILSEGTFVHADTTITAHQSNITIEGQGDATVLDCSAVTQYPLQIYGAITTTNSTLTANATAGQKVCSVTDGSKFAAGNWVRIRSTGAFDSGTDTDVGELQQIASISTNDLTMELPLYNAYLTTDTATVDVMTMREGITIKNLKMTGAGSAKNQYAFQIHYAHDLRIENLTLEDFYQCAIQLRDVVSANIRGCRIRGCSSSSYGYGISQLFSTRDISIEGNHFEDCRHGITHGYVGSPRYGVGQDIVITGNTFVGSLTNTAGQVMTHHTCTDVLIANNVITSDMGIAIESPHTTVVGNRIVTSPNEYGVYISATAHDVSVIGNNIKHGSVGVFVGAGAIANLNVLNNVFGVSIATGNAYHVQIQRSGSSNVCIKGNTFYGGTSAAFLALNEGSGASSNFVIADNHIEGASSYALRIGYTTLGGGLSGLLIANNYIDANGSDAIYIDDDNGGTNFVDQILITGNIINNAVEGIDANKYTDNLQITNNQFIGCTEPYDVTLTNGFAGYVMIHGNYWKGCTNDGATGGDSIVVRVSSNVDKDGAWEAGDDPG